MGIVKDALESTRVLGDTLKQCELIAKLLDSAEIDHLMTPANYTGLAGTMVGRILSAKK